MRERETSMNKINKFRLTHKLFILPCHTSISAAQRRRRLHSSRSSKLRVTQLWIFFF